uniref:Uncharacterized protein n=1 Tax=Anguilla anguilla TaxID=7936 RepID=A0A0E9PDB5_ANGAN
MRVDLPGKKSTNLFIFTLYF